MSASSSNASELRLCDTSSEHAHPSHDRSPLAHHASPSPASHASCTPPHSPGGQIDEYARNFDCNICLHTCQDPVVTMCGHLFCWPCLYHCLSLPSASKGCPVCKADVQDKIVPLYGCGRVGPLAEKFHGVQIPCRPSAIAHSVCRQTGPIHAIQHMPSQGGGLLGRYGQGTASLVMRRRRFNNEKEFVLHWTFIIAASATIAFLLLAC